MIIRNTMQSKYKLSSLGTWKACDKLVETVCCYTLIYELGLECERPCHFLKSLG